MTSSEHARAAVASCTLAAAHRRDHQPDCACAPHCVEVVHLGDQAAMVCHDCRTDSGFVDPRAADQLCKAHLSQTRAA